MDPLNIAPGQTPLIADVYSYTGPRLFTSRRRVLDAGVKSTSRFQDDFGGWPVCVRSALCLRPMTKNGRRVFGYLTKPEFTRVSPARQRAEGVADECGTRSSTVPSKPMTGLPPMDHAIVWLPGTTLLIDTQSHFPEFGVIVARALQSRTLADAAAEPVDRVLWYQQPRYPSHSRPASLAMTQLVVGVMANYSRKERSVHRDDVAAWKLVCLERAVEVPFMYDRPFANDAGLQRWMALRKAWNPSGALVNGHAPCPGSNVAVLQRDGTASGDGARPLSDYAVLGRVLGSLGVCAYRNVSNVHCQASLAQQASVFESYGLMLSPYACRACTRANAVPPPLLPPRASHSSQLRNIVRLAPGPLCVDALTRGRGGIVADLGASAFVHA